MIIKSIDLGSMFVAPMAGVSDVGFRHIARKNGATYSVTEMVSAKALVYKSEKTVRMLQTSPLEKPVGVQLFGSEPEVMAQACKHPALQKFDVVDINMGCPAPKIVKNKEGSRLLENLELARQIIKACRQATDKILSVKMRMGYKDDKTACFELAKICEEEGVDFITIHGRTQSQMYGDVVDYQTIKQIKQMVKIPVVGNGDIRDTLSYQKMLETGVDAVMIGRGCLGNVWLFNQLKNDIQVTQQQKLEDIKLHIDIMKTQLSEKILVPYFRKHFLWYAKNLKLSPVVKIGIMSAKSLDEVYKLLVESTKSI